MRLVVLHSSSTSSSTVRMSPRAHVLVPRCVFARLYSYAYLCSYTYTSAQTALQQFLLFAKLSAWRFREGRHPVGGCLSVFVLLPLHINLCERG